MAVERCPKRYIIITDIKLTDIISLDKNNTNPLV